MRIKWLVNKNKELIEQGQDVPVRFAFLYKDPTKKNYFVSQTPLMKCRDYFNEVWLKENYPDFEVPMIYGFKINHLQHELKDPDWFYLLLDFNLLNKDSLNKFKEWLPTFNSFEVEKGFKPTEIVGEQLRWNRFIIRCDRKYFKNNVGLSMYTCILRIMCRSNGEVTKLPWDWLKTTESYVDLKKFVTKFNVFPIIDKLSAISGKEILNHLQKANEEDFLHYVTNNRTSWHNYTGFYNIAMAAKIGGQYLRDKFTRTMNKYMKEGN